MREPFGNRVVLSPKTARMMDGLDRAYRLGMKAAFQGKTMSVCWFRTAGMCGAWMQGWHNARAYKEAISEEASDEERARA
jgi:ribosome modulation factor